MGINVELPDDLTAGATAEASRSFDGDIARLVAVAVRHYLTTQELARALLAAPALAGLREPVEAQVDPFLLLRHLGVDDSMLAEVVSGTAKIPEQAAANFEAMGLSVGLDAVLAGQALATEDLVKLPAGVTALRSPRAKVHPVALLKSLGLKDPDLDALKSGTLEIPAEVAANFQAIGLSVGLDALLAGQPLPDEDVVPLESQIGPAVFAAPRVVRPGDDSSTIAEGSEEEVVAGIIASSDLSDERLTDAASGIGRIAERVAELRRND